MMMPQSEPLAKAGYVFIPNDNSFPLKMGDTLFVTPNTEVDQNLKFPLTQRSESRGLLMACFGMRDMSRGFH